MTKAELIRRLEGVPDTDEIMIMDGFNGGGVPREINFGPTNHLITSHEDLTTGDCAGRRGEMVVVIGYGCY